MPIYIMMTTLSPEVLSDPRGRKKVGREWKRRVDELCPDVKWISHYALLGRYDFIDIYEAPDDATAHKVSLLSRSLGAVSAESWAALPYERYLDLSGEVERTLARQE